MNIRRKYLNCIFLFLICSFTVDAHSTTLKQDINWPEFMSQQDMVWEKLPEYWYESAYLGNGKLGLIQKEMYSGSPDYLPVTLPCILEEK